MLQLMITAPSTARLGISSQTIQKQVFSLAIALPAQQGNMWYALRLQGSAIGEDGVDYTVNAAIGMPSTSS